ncbi:MAG: metalloregulator ArsR/SmtB family transcription factor [Lachnospiraceae bacterium]
MQDKSVNHMPDPSEFLEAAETFQYLGDSKRLSILWILCHQEECVQQIAATVQMSEPAVSYHLRILKQHGLIRSRREGKEVYYTLENDKKASLVHQMIDDYFELDCMNKRE